jgi:hypothetical protein
MPKFTKNYRFLKPEADEYYNIDDFNANADKIDEELNAVSETFAAAGGFIKPGGDGFVPDTPWLLLGRTSQDIVAHYRGSNNMVFMQIRVPLSTPANSIIGTLPEGFRPQRIGMESLLNPGVQFAPGGGTGFYVVQNNGDVRAINAPVSSCFCYSTLSPN